MAIAPLSPETPVEQTAGPLSSNIATTPVKSKQGYSLSTPGSLDPTDTTALKARLQEMLDRQTGPMNTFLGGLQEASAWGAGGAEGPSAALTAVKRQRQLQDESTIGTMKDLAALNASEAQAKNDAAFVKSILGGQAGTPGTFQGVGSGTALPDPVRQRMMGAPNATAAKAIYDEWLKTETTESTKSKYSADMNAPVEIMFNGKPLTVTRRQFAQYSEKNPEFAQALESQNPGLSQKMGAGDPALAARAAGVPVLSGLRSNDKQWELYDAWVAGGRKGNPVARPGSSPHEKGEGLDVNMAKATDKDIAWLKANGYYQPDWATNKTSDKYDPNHWELAKARASVAVNREPGGANSPITGATKQEFESNVKLEGEKKTAANAAFIDAQYKPLAEKVRAQADDVLTATDVLEAIKTGSYGPGSGINQAVMRAAKALGIGESEKDAQQYLNNLTIERAKELFKASGARAAMGAQFTQTESENFAKTLATITDPKEYIKNVYQMKIALAKINDAHLQYLDDNPTNMSKANKDWKNSGEARRILLENVDYLRERSEGKKAAPKAAPNISNAAAEAWLKANPNHPDAPAVRAKLGNK
jgi:hypothetical protein